MTWDPLEGVGPDGVLTTGVGSHPIRPPFDAVLAESSEQLVARLGDALHGLYVYGSVATGRARAPRSDLDLYAITREPAAAACREVGQALSAQFVGTVRGVGIAAVVLADVWADDVGGRADRCFIRHYCLHVAGHDLRPELVDCHASVELARGFTGDIGSVATGVMDRLRDAADAEEQRRLVAVGARRLLMAAATLLSARAGGWTTDRSRGAELLTTAAPELAAHVGRARGWTDVDASRRPVPDTAEVVATFGALRDWLVHAYARAADGRGVDPH